MASPSVPAPPAPDGRPISLTAEDTLAVPDDPVVPYVEGDGCGPDLWTAARRVLDAAVERAYEGRRRVAWFEVLAGEKAYRKQGSWLPSETIAAFRRYLVGLKGPLATPVGAGIRSLNVALRAQLDLYAAVRPVRWLTGVPSPVADPSAVDLVLFRENTEDVHAGIEWPAGSEEAARVVRFLQEEMGVRTIRFPDSSAIGVKPASRQGAERLVRAAIDYALTHGHRRLALVHKGDIMKFTEGAFKDWAFELACSRYRDLVITKREQAVLHHRQREPEQTVAELAHLVEPGYDAAPPDRQADYRAEVEAALELAETHGADREAQLLIEDITVDVALGRLLRQPEDFEVLVALNLNGDYLTDALAAQVGGSPMVAGGSINYVTGHALFETLHGTAPLLAGRDRANPTSLLLAGRMLLEHLGWDEAAGLVERGIEGALRAKTVTDDLAQRMDDATALSCSAFAEAVIEHLQQAEPETVPRSRRDRKGE